MGKNRKIGLPSKPIPIKDRKANPFGKRRKNGR